MTHEPTRAAEDAAHPSSRASTGSWSELFSGEHATASLVLAGGVAVFAMNTFITSALLPTTVEEIGGEQYYSWVTTTFMVASVLTAMLVARALASWGAARAYLVAFLLFAVGSVGAALTPTMELLLVARVLQGLGGGLLAGLGYAVIRDALPERLWTRATGLVSAMWGFGTLVGPATGGLFAQLELWRGAFWLLAVIAVVLGVMALRALPRRSRVAEDFGAVPVAPLLVLVLAAAAFSAATIVGAGWPTASALLAGGALLIGFVLADRTASSPVFPRITYQRGNPLKWIYIVLGVLTSAAMVEIFLPKFGQELAGMSPLVAGLFGATVSVGWSFVQLGSASVDSERASRRLMVVGPVLMVAGLVVFAATQHSTADWIAWAWVAALVLAGAGVGLAFPHFSVAAMRSSDDPVEASKAAAGVGTAELVANAISSALIGALVVAGGPGAAGSMAMGVGVAALGVVGVVAALRALRHLRGAHGSHGSDETTTVLA